MKIFVAKLLSIVLFITTFSYGKSTALEDASLEDASWGVEVTNEYFPFVELRTDAALEQKVIIEGVPSTGSPTVTLYSGESTTDCLGKFYIKPFHKRNGKWEKSKIGNVKRFRKKILIPIEDGDDNDFNDALVVFAFGRVEL